MIELDKISRSFGKKELFKELSLSVSSGEVCGLVGLNGIGKTTLLRIIAGTLSISAGTISVLNTAPKQSGSFYRRIGMVLDNDGFNTNLSFRENIEFFAKLRRISSEKLHAYLQSYWQHLCNKVVQVKHFSRGERMQCGLARAFLGFPELLLLDEPASNLDIEGYNLLCKLDSDAHARGATVLISSHRLDTISELCSSVAFLSSLGIRKVSLIDRANTHWVLRGRNLSLAVGAISNCGGTVLKSDTSELHFNDISKDQMEQLLPKCISEGAIIWELFLCDPVMSAMEHLDVL